MGLLSQAPIGSLPARPARAWVNAARPVDRSMPGHEVVRSRGQIRPDSATIMLTVVVPEIVMNSLERPYSLAGRGAQRDDRVRIPVVAEPQHTVVVGCSAARRHEHEVALGIGDEGGPRVGASALVRERASPFRVRGIARVLRDRGGSCRRSRSR